MSDTIYYKIANCQEEFNQIHALNYQTFVEEIPQHQSNDQKKLIDKFNDKNIYVIAIQQKKVIGMLAFNDKRPFSLDYKIDNLNHFLPQQHSIVELRLLSVKPDKRGGVILMKLIGFIFKWIKSNNQNYDYVIISGTTRQLNLYRKFGFKPFYHLVGNADAKYQPMILNVKEFIEKYGDKLQDD